jgi:hypothetical protein
MSTPFFHRVPSRSVLLWTAFWRALQPLRPACARTTTFLWLAVVLVGFCLRPDLAGVTSLVRGLGLSEASYYCLLHFFHSPALNLEQLTRLWQQTLPHLFRRRLMRVNGRAVLLVDGLKRPKEGKKMPGVKSLHQESRCNAKASFIMGHSLQAVAVLVQAAEEYLAVPVAARIHEGVVWSNRTRRTLLDKLGALLASLPWEEPVTVVADAYYAAAKFARGLLAQGHHLVTRLRTTAVACFPASPRPGKRRGRPAVYGRKTKLRDWFALEKRFRKAPSPVYGESGVTLRYYTYDLLWRRLGCLVRLVWVIHPTRGQRVLLCTDLTLPPLDIIRLYGWRFKIEVSFKQAIHTVGAYAYHFWMENMKPIRRGDGSQHPIASPRVTAKLFAASWRPMSATSSWASSPKDCSNTWPLLSAALSGSISTPTSARPRPKKHLPSGWFRARCATVGRNFPLVPQKAIPSRNSWLPKSTSVAAATRTASN